MWKKSKDGGFVGRAGDLSVVIAQKGDGRWTWEVTKKYADSPMASGVAPSANAAKRNAENFVERGAH